MVFVAITDMNIPSDQSLYTPSSGNRTNQLRLMKEDLDIVIPSFPRQFEFLRTCPKGRPEGKPTNAVLLSK